MFPTECKKRSQIIKKKWSENQKLSPKKPNYSNNNNILDYIEIENDNQLYTSKTGDSGLLSSTQEHKAVNVIQMKQILYASMIENI